MNKFNKKDYLNIFVCIISFFVLFIIVLLKNGVSFSSVIDHCYQHYLIPEYFRTLFYDTKDLFPDFAFNLGAGQNIYNFSYYGLFSPVILISYLFPFITMKTYLLVAMIILIVLSIFLFYVWISKRELNKTLRFITTFLFSMSSPLLFHIHRHPMFIIYIPFLILGLIGIDKYYNKKSPFILMIASFLILTSSYFFAIPSLIVLFLYSIFVYLEKQDFNFKSFVKTHLTLSIYFIIPILCSMFVLLPSFIAILNNRIGEVSTYVDLLPDINFSNIIYNGYGMGLTSIAIVAIIYGLKGRKETKFLSIVFLAILCIPLINYILNIFMYLNSKVFIPFLPLALLLILNFLKDVFNKEKLPVFLIITLLISLLGCIKYNYAILYIVDLSILFLTVFVYKKYNCNLFLIIFLIIISFGTSLYINLKDSFVNNDVVSKQYSFNYSLNNDFYRVSDVSNKSYNSNSIMNINMYKTSMYSSVTNKYYKDFYWNIFNVENPNRNNGLISDNNNILFNTYMGVKYMITEDSVYENKDAFTIGYSSSKLMSQKEFDKLSYPYTIEALLNYVIVKDDKKSDYKTTIETIDFGLNKEYNFSVDKETTYKIKNPYDLSNKLLLVEFKMNRSEKCNVADTYIQINDVKNVLTCKSWKYHNQNYSFAYVLKPALEYDIKVGKGSYQIRDLNIYTLDSNLSKLKDNHSEFIIKSIKGDVIKGSINALESGYFTLSIPYDKGYNIFVDAEKISYEKVNKSFIGFPINKGMHNIKIIYHAPLANVGKIISTLGICLFLVIILKKRQYKNM